MDNLLPFAPAPRMLDPDQFADAYLDWWNNYLTVQRFADDYGLTVDHARMLIEIGRACHQQRVAELQEVAA